MVLPRSTLKRSVLNGFVTVTVLFFLSIGCLVLPATSAKASTAANRRQMTSQESRSQSEKYRRQAYQRSPNFKVSKLRVAKLKRSSFWNGRPYQFATPLIVGDVLYVGVDAGVFYAIGLAHGDKLWKFKTAGPVQSSAVEADGVIFVGDAEGSVYALDASSGALKWSSTVDGEILSAPLVQGARLYVATLSGRLYALDRNTGLEQWHTESGAKEFGFSIRRAASPVVSGGLLLLGSADGQLRAVSAADGHMVWQSRIGNSRHQLYGVTGAPAVDSSRVYATSADELLVALDPQSGKQQWAVDAGGPNDLVLSGNTLYASGAGVLSAVEPEDGGIKWQQDFERPEISTPAAGDGFVAVTATTDKIFVVDSATGDVAYEHYIRSGSFGDPMVAGENIYVLSNTGRLYVFKVRKTEPKPERKSISKHHT
jgi:outer membrane protein assembly factor BamB